MVRRSLVLAPLVLAAVALAAFFSYRAMTGSSQDASQPEAVGPPTGRETVLRIAAPASLACRQDAVDAQIFLDDLGQPSEAVLAGERSRGALGVQALVRFDPKVIQVAEVSLPDARNTNPDAVALARHWLLAPARIDNSADTVLLAAIAAVSTLDEQGSPGADPFAAGEAQLIMNVRLHTVGEGSSELRLDDIKVLGGGGAQFETEAREATIDVAPGECAAQLPSSANWPPQRSPSPTPFPTYHTDVFDCRPSSGGGITRQPDPACEDVLRPSSIPTPHAGCDWIWGNTETGWVAGDVPSQRSNAFVEICGGYLSGRAWHFESETIQPIKTRDTPIEGLE